MKTQLIRQRPRISPQPSTAKAPRYGTALLLRLWMVALRDGARIFFRPQSHRIRKENGTLTADLFFGGLSWERTHRKEQDLFVQPLISTHYGYIVRIFAAEIRTNNNLIIIIQPYRITVKRIKLSSVLFSHLIYFDKELLYERQYQKGTD